MLRTTPLAPLAAAALSVVLSAQNPTDSSAVDGTSRPLGLKHARFDPLVDSQRVRAALRATRHP